jgi:hypothetical protein
VRFNERTAETVYRCVDLRKIADASSRIMTRRSLSMS